jgi:NAD(P)H-dependent flavin oxidoreductase YrpB (nitropropane dioxygenase family)
VIRNAYIDDWEQNRAPEAQRLLEQGVIPAEADICAKMERRELDPRTFRHAQAFLMGQVAAVIDTIEPAEKVVRDMVHEAVGQLRAVNEMTMPIVARL